MKAILILIGIIGYANISFAQTNFDSLKKHVVKLTSYPMARNEKNIEYLNKAAEYIKANFSNYSKRVVFQKYEVEGKIYQNVLASFGPDTGKRFIVGAHYDVCGEVPGADDNASGVAGLLEIARQLSKFNGSLPFRIDLVAYTLEEPPYFNTQQMGSYKHALSLKENNIAVIGMINLECIGYYTDRPRSQHYPFFGYRLLHGGRANFISIVQKWGMGNWSSRMRYLMKQYAQGIRVVNYKPIAFTNATKLSDHKNYWKLGIPAMMITNTAMYRNHRYHQETDTYETLDYFRMAKVVDMVFQSLIRYRE